MTDKVDHEKFELFKKTWEDYPNQDNEGYIPDRGGYKCGFFAAWEILTERLDALKIENHQLKQALEHAHKDYEGTFENIVKMNQAQFGIDPNIYIPCRGCGKEHRLADISFHPTCDNCGVMI